VSVRIRLLSFHFWLGKAKLLAQDMEDQVLYMKRSLVNMSAPSPRIPATQDAVST
jgi:hypothetical protein